MHICVRLLRCPFYSDGQFQGLRMQNGQQVWLSRFYFQLPNAKERVPRHDNFMKGMTFLKNVSEATLFHSKKFLYLTLALSILTSCAASTKTLTFSCQERQIEIYVDDEFLGRDLVHYTVPKGREYVEVSCREGGVEIYHRRINVKNRNGTLIELQMPKNYKYSSKPY